MPEVGGLRVAETGGDLVNRQVRLHQGGLRAFPSHFLEELAVRGILSLEPPAKRSLRDRKPTGDLPKCRHMVGKGLELATDLAGQVAVPCRWTQA